LIASGLSVNPLNPLNPRSINQRIDVKTALTPGVKNHSVLSEAEPERFTIDELVFDRPGDPITEIEPESLMNHFDATKADCF